VKRTNAANAPRMPKAMISDHFITSGNLLGPALGHDLQCATNVHGIIAVRAGSASFLVHGMSTNSNRNHSNIVTEMKIVRTGCCAT
jgi:hypothetical protein